MTTDAQKQREMMHADQLMRSLGCNWVIQCSTDEIEWPDLVIQDKEHKFGLEIREITKGSEGKKGNKLRANESNNKKIIQKLINDYDSNSNTPLKVNIVQKLDNVLEIVDALIAFSYTAKSYDFKKIKTLNGSIINVTCLPPEIGIYKDWKYIPDRVGFVKNIDSEFLTEIVLDKEKKIQKYKKHLHDVRLLLVSDSHYKSGKVSFIDEKINIKSDFNEIYLLICPNKIYATNS